MYATLDSSKCESDSVTSRNSLQIVTDKFRSNHLIISNVTNTELYKRIASLELDNKHLKIDLENFKLELDGKNAANQGLKNKIAELHMEIHRLVQEKQKLHISVIDLQCNLGATENSTQWYEGQMHDVQAKQNTLQTELDIYKIMLRKKHQNLVQITSKWKKLVEDYIIVIKNHKKEINILKAEIQKWKMSNSNKNYRIQSEAQPRLPITMYMNVSSRLDMTEDELQISLTKLQILQQRLNSSEIEKVLMVSAFNKQQTLLSSIQNSLQNCQCKRVDLAELAFHLHLKLHKLNSQNKLQKVNLMHIKQERKKVQEAIEQLHLQLTKVIAQYKILKKRNVKLEEKLNSVQDIWNETKRLKSLSNIPNTFLINRLRQKKKNADILKNQQLYHKQNKQQIFNINQKDKAPKSTKTFEDNLDEGYADGSMIGFPITNLPSPRILDPELVSTINDVLSKGKNFWEPIQVEINRLHLKLENYMIKKITRTTSCYNIPLLTFSND